MGIEAGSEFLLEGKPRSEYEEYCNLFNRFITGPAVEGREITELTEKYQKFYEVMKSTQLKAQESNRLEDALYGVAIRHPLSPQPVLSDSSMPLRSNSLPHFLYALFRHIPHQRTGHYSLPDTR